MVPLRLGASSYSFWHFTPDKVPLETVFEQCRAMGLDGVEILQQQMTDTSPAACQALKRRAFSLGLDLYALSIHQDFVWPEAAKRQEHIDHTRGCIDQAHELGIPCIRLNSGRWGTSGTFDELMAARGIETPLPGYSDDDAFGWCIDSIAACLPHAEQAGVVLALENHWGLTFAPSGVLRIVDALPSPWLAVLMDCGNFLEEPYDSLELLAPRAVMVHAKTYCGGGEWYTLDLDYPRIARMLQRVGFQGWVSLEMEGREPAATAVPQSVALLRAAFAAAD
ncbi:MAG: sugar phosphate isomerase/epimerase [Fimbriimonadaceae bacterium]|nr:sugar phosphate isomerase/epimerase [Fimbriimonadaceae bacterium]